MSLNWNAQAVKDYNKIDEEGMRGVMNALIWSTMIVGMGEISADPSSKTYFKRFAARLDFAQRLNGSFLITKKGDTTLNEKMVERFVGLKTNVSYETPSAWLKHFIANERKKF